LIFHCSVCNVSLTLSYWYLTDKVLSLSYTVSFDFCVYWGMYRYGCTLSLMLVLDGSGLPVPCPRLLYPWERALLPIVQEAHFRYIYKVTAGMSLHISGVVHLPPDKFVWKFLFLDLLNTFKFMLKLDKMRYFTWEPSYIYEFMTIYFKVRSWNFYISILHVLCQLNTQS